MNNKSIKLIVLPSLALFLSACGGGNSSSDNNQTDSAASNIQPRVITTDNWQSARLIQAGNPTKNHVEVVGSELSINVLSEDIRLGSHLQIYINSDNKPETGFQFENEAWEESGVDFLIEDGDLFKSTQNNSGWNWNVNVGAIEYTINTDSATAKIDLSLLGNICNNLKVGVMTRDETWKISSFSPTSTKMQTYQVSYCNTVTADTVKPVIKLLGANPLNINVNDTFNDAGATATDNIDGDVTSNIIPSSTVNTAVAGSYEVSYSVTDIAGNSSAVTRTVIVNENPTTGIVVDGNSNDWSNIPTFSSSADAIMKVSDDAEKLYVLVTSSNLGDNIQVLMDTDNNPTTGLELSTQISSWLAGADHMVENNSLEKSTNNAVWSWDFGIADIEYIRTTDTLELAIKKSDLDSLTNKIPMGFVSRTIDWNVNYILPEQSIPTYTMQSTITVNPVIANNDNVTTLNTKAININVLANDSSTKNNALAVTIVAQPTSGKATVSSNKSVSYTPNASFTGTDTFTYQISDTKGNIDTASIKVIVTEPVVINKAPAANNDSVTLEQDTQVNIQVLLNDSDADNDTLVIDSVSNPANGSATQSNGVINYKPNAGFSGTDSFTYRVSDGKGGTDTATVTATITKAVIVNISPVASNDSVTIKQDTQVNIQVLLNDSDANNDTLIIGSVSKPANGSATQSNGVITYKPKTGFSGTDSFTYNVSDGKGGTATATVTVIITAIVLPNRAPNAEEDVATVFFNETVTVDVLANDTDPDGDTLSVDPSSVAALTQGQATLNSDGTITFDPQGNVASLSVFYTVRDGKGGTDSAVLTIASTNPADNNVSFPTVNNEFVTTTVNTPIFIDVLANDFDSDGDTLSIDMVDTPANGTTEKVTQNGVAGILYTPNPGFTGVNKFFYGVPDGRGNNGSGFVEVTVQ